MQIGAVIGLAWLVKPLIGFIIDKYAISKRTWITGSSICSALICLIMGLNPIISLTLLTGLLLLSNSNTAWRDVANDGQMAIVGKREGITSKIQAIQWSAVTVASILTGLVGGWLADHSNYHTAFLMLIPFYGLLIWTACLYKEDKPVKLSFPSFKSSMKELFLDKNLLLVALFIFLYKFAPSIGTPLQFKMINEFHFTYFQLGQLDTLGSLFGLAGAVLYYKIGMNINLKKGLLISTIISAILTLAYLYFTPLTAVIYTVIGSITDMFFMLLILDFMARNTKPGYEAMSFALLCSVSNLAATADKLTGSWLYPLFGLNWLIIMSAITSFICLPILFKISFKK